MPEVLASSMIDKKYFFQSIKDKKLFSKLTVPRVINMESVINMWNQKGYTDLRWLAYMFATMYWETAQTMQPIEEYCKGKGKLYGSKIKRSGVKYLCPDKKYYGRGFVQLTWYENYELMGRLLGFDLLKNPELCLNTEVATKVLFEGMTKGSSSFGDFTGKCLEMYFNKTTEDWLRARYIINGKDQAARIANYGKTFLSCLKPS
ncbi:MAG TPA: glycoside hydrolase family 19 protein [Chitinophagaceae bacterium]|nr:glycoside hydrolase family 19 protein [Chitinophagaceae bacterium]